MKLPGREGKAGSAMGVRWQESRGWLDNRRDKTKLGARREEEKELGCRYRERRVQKGCFKGTDGVEAVTR